MPDDGYSTLLINLLQIGVPFAAYFAGIVIRKLAMPGDNSPSLGCQCLLGIPVSLVIVSPVLTVFSNSIHNVSAFLLSVGIIMEHGMLVSETAAKHLQSLLGGQDPGIPPAVAAATLGK